MTFDHELKRFFVVRTFSHCAKRRLQEFESAAETNNFFGSAVVKHAALNGEGTALSPRRRRTILLFFRRIQDFSEEFFFVKVLGISNMWHGGMAGEACGQVGGNAASRGWHVDHMEGAHRHSY